MVVFVRITDGDSKIMFYYFQHFLLLESVSQTLAFYHGPLETVPHDATERRTGTGIIVCTLNFLYSPFSFCERTCGCFLGTDMKMSVLLVESKLSQSKDLNSACACLLAGFCLA